MFLQLLRGYSHAGATGQQRLLPEYSLAMLQRMREHIAEQQF